MKNIILLLLLLAGGGSMAVAQGKLTEEKRKEFEAQKVAFFTRELDLSPSEAAVFWPLYNEMRKKRREIEGQMRKGANEVNKASALAEEKYAEAIGKKLAWEDELQKIKKEYYQRMTGILPASKVWILGEAERKFQRQLFEKLCCNSAVKK